MKYSKIFITAFIAIVSGFTFVSCDKDEETTTNDLYVSDEYARNLRISGQVYYSDSRQRKQDCGGRHN